MYSEEEIIRYLRSKDERCVQMMFDNYYHTLCVYAYGFLSSVEDAEDVVQNVFISFWERGRGQDFKGSLRSYLLGAVSKSSLKYLRDRGHICFEDIEEHVNASLEDIPFEDEEEMNALRNRLRTELDRLPEKARAVFRAIVLENLPYKAVAARFGISVNTVKTQYAHALKKLRAHFGDTLVLLVWLERAGYKN